jgi:predicted nucleic acid-binding protein
MLVDDGEAEAIALAVERDYRIALDDRQARLVGSNLGLTVIGTIGILVKAKRGGIIIALKPLLNDLELVAKLMFQKTMRDDGTGEQHESFMRGAARLLAHPQLPELM